ncbi:cobyrinate a,c-diamide synthase [Anaerocolumna xylanovorans]|uniref:Cobyrinate a,c-diamide synthase n=1 Tax=Anaerocolumna xylanovorans DSM 12503 TaxID=1121345 RepID=A0A1M7XYT8_9FIRM|nr:cobyrinate a,c-diamide synthase [Anaerocolumna xylanovorans]SHO44224.1 hydrogenobyrinic acid a,c-diamide synthase (glutamine-hydrolysing) [Anaerocolumna xylanovorans DSM 12503]
MKAPRIMIAATGSGSGKTLLTCALLQVMADMGKRTAAFKCGPDYIDPMFHEKVIGVPSKNLDTFFTDENTTRYLLLEGAKEKDISIIEGVMGLYDGLGGIKEEASSYHLARATKTPVILAIDAHGMGRSVIPLISGFLQYDTQHLIKGVLLNGITGMFYELIKPEIEKQLPVTVLGYFPRQKDVKLESRHLGLKMPGEIEGLKEEVKRLAAVMAGAVDIRKIVTIAREADDLKAEEIVISPGSTKVRIGIAKDEAFCFYYEDNLRLLQKYNAELVFFSPLWDKELPKNLQGIILGGGYPELYAKPLAENEGMKESIKAAISQGMPSIAECGGFLYLHETLKNAEGEVFPMVGAVKGTCHYTGKLVRFGYIEITAGTESYLGENTKIRGHEFHYFDSTDNGASCVAQKPVTERNWQCVHAGKNHWWGFPHLYYYSNTEYVSRFLERAGNYEENAQPCID